LITRGQQQDGLLLLTQALAELQPEDRRNQGDAATGENHGNPIPGEPSYATRARFVLEGIEIDRKIHIGLGPLPKATSITTVEGHAALNPSPTATLGLSFSIVHRE
jgi:hypothetical protein